MSLTIRDPKSDRDVIMKRTHAQPRNGRSHNETRQPTHLTHATHAACIERPAHFAAHAESHARMLARTPHDRRHGNGMRRLMIMGCV